MSPTQDATADRATTRNTLVLPSADNAPLVITTISDGMGGKMASPRTTGMIQK
jgi:hypothetical protein